MSRYIKIPLPLEPSVSVICSHGVTEPYAMRQITLNKVNCHNSRIIITHHNFKDYKIREYKYCNYLNSQCYYKQKAPAP